MSEEISPYSTPTPWDLVSSGYAETTMPFLSQFSAQALEMAKLHYDDHILDLACGSGTLSLLAADHVSRICAIDFSRLMLNEFERTVSLKGIKNIKMEHGDGQHLKFDSSIFDAVFSMFGLIFFPDRMKGFQEAYRVLKPGGKIIVSSWAPIEDSPLMKLMFAAVKSMDSTIPDGKKNVRTLEDKTVFENELSRAGFKKIKITRVTKGFDFKSVSEFWTAMSRGSAPIVLLKEKWGKEVFLEREKLALLYLNNELPKINSQLTSDAWIGMGLK